MTAHNLEEQLSNGLGRKLIFSILMIMCLYLWNTVTTSQQKLIALQGKLNALEAKSDANDNRHHDEFNSHYINPRIHEAGIAELKTKLEDKCVRSDIFDLHVKESHE